jgi:phosphatidylserine/phosphatidylglycerophosphate/cardiolipin synthase-like enzyme
VTQDSLLNLLRSSFADQKLSREERQRLREAAAALRADEAGRLRNAAFEIAADGIEEEHFRTRLKWLEDVIRCLTSSESSPEHSHMPPGAWFSPQQNCPGKIRELIAAVRKTLDICVFTITDDRLTASVIEAHRRGVKVRIITDNDKAADLGSDADRLRQCGIRLRIDRTQYHMHHKFAVFDNALLLNGSYNWTRGAAEQNEENFLVLSHQPLVERYQQEFNSLWNSLADD